MEALRRARSAPQQLRCHLHSVSTVQEEIGLQRGTAAGSIQPDVAIAADVTHASDCPSIDKQKQGDISGARHFPRPNIIQGFGIIELMSSTRFLFRWQQ